MSKFGPKGGRSCAKARRAYAEEFGLGVNFEPQHTPFCRDVKIRRDFRTFGRLCARQGLFE